MLIVSGQAGPLVVSLVSLVLLSHLMLSLILINWKLQVYIPPTIYCHLEALHHIFPSESDEMYDIC